MKMRVLFFTIMAALLVFTGSGLAAKPPDAGNGGGGSGGGEPQPPDLGDLIKLYRDADGVPYPDGRQIAGNPSRRLSLRNARNPAKFLVSMGLRLPPTIQWLCMSTLGPALFQPSARPAPRRSSSAA